MKPNRPRVWLIGAWSALALRASLSAVEVDVAPTGPAPSDRALARSIYQELIETNTVGKNGAAPAVRALAARLKTAGFTDEELTLAGPTPESQNLVVRLRGRGAGRPVLFIGHLDVVEARREDWTTDPFQLVERDGYFYGRGTMDMKDGDTSLVVSLIRLKREGFVPSRDIIVALTDHEEDHPEINGVAWLIEHRRELIDAEFCINPDGGSGELKSGKPVVMEFQTAEKTYLAYELEVTDKGGHGSLPTKDNAIYTLAAGLGRLAAYEFPLEVNETTRLFFERSAAQESGQTKADLLAVAQNPPDLTAAARLAAGSTFYNAMLRTTCVATMLSGGHAENALPQVARAVLNARVLPDDSPDEVTATLRRVLADDRIKVTRHDRNRSSPRSPVRHDVFAAVEKVTARRWPGVVVTPIMSTGASDGAFLRAAGVPVYGVSGSFLDVDDIRAHGKDERLGVKEFYDAVDFMTELMAELTK